MSPLEPSLEHLEIALTAKIETAFELPQDFDVLAHLLSDKRSLNTRKAYEKDINDFFRLMTGKPPTTDTVLEFLHLTQKQAVSVVLRYKSRLIDKGLKESTVNRRLAAIKSLTAMGRKLGVCEYSLEDIKGERLMGRYRDTTGIDSLTYKQVLEQCPRHTPLGKRDYAILRLLWDNALRRGELVKCNVADFDVHNRTLSILGKGRGSYQELIDLSPGTVQALSTWRASRKKTTPNEPLFTALDFHNQGHRLSGEAIRVIVCRYCKAAGVTKRMSPHRIRHSAITAALDATDGNVRKVQKLSRHKQIDTLMIYDDNRQRVQGELTGLLSDLVED
jgi:integrase/recombinase XerC